MVDVLIYTGDNCPYCERAKGLLHKKGVKFKEINVRNNPPELEIMKKRSAGRQTIPQIFINERHIGGCDDLFALESSGELNKLIQS